MNKNNLGILQIAVLVAVVTASAVPMIYALSMLWSSQVGVNVVATVQLGVYSDSACTTTVQSMDFGNQNKGAYAYKSLYIKNTGTADITLDWSSNYPSSILAGDDWVYNTGASWASIKSYVLKAGQSIETKYQIYILPNAATGSQTWAISLGSV